MHRAQWRMATTPSSPPSAPVRDAAQRRRSEAPKASAHRLGSCRQALAGDQRGCGPPRGESSSGSRQRSRPQQRQGRAAERHSQLRSCSQRWPGRQTRRCRNSGPSGSDGCGTAASGVRSPLLRTRLASSRAAWGSAAPEASASHQARRRRASNASGSPSRRSHQCSGPQPATPRQDTRAAQDMRKPGHALCQCHHATQSLSAEAIRPSCHAPAGAAPSRLAQLVDPAGLSLVVMAARRPLAAAAARLISRRRSPRRAQGSRATRPAAAAPRLPPSAAGPAGRAAPPAAPPAIAAGPAPAAAARGSGWRSPS